MHGQNQHLIVHSREPLNAEPPLARLRRHFLTPAEDFYIRSHGNIPALDPDAYRLKVGGDVATVRTLSLREIATRFAPRRVTATLQCAGNRRADMLAVEPVSGEPWAAGAIGNAEWAGVSLAEVLDGAGIGRRPGRHVAFAGADDCATADGRTTFGASIPVDKALGGEVLLATTMNGEPLRPEHGAPLRVVVPGYAGARSVKWLTEIRVQGEPSQNFYQQKEYRLFPAAARADTADAWDGMMIYEMPLNSAICEPAALQTLRAGRCAIRGYATAGARRISRVEVSINGGRHWMTAAICGQDDEPAGEGAGDLVVEASGDPWAWAFWEAEVDIPVGRHELAVRAWDSAGQTQPALPDEVWNFKGYLCASWHRIWVEAE